MTLWDSVCTIVRKAFPDLFYRGVFRYQIAIARGGNRYDVVPAKVKWLPTIPLREIWPGVAGVLADPRLGSFVLIAFVDADPGQPVIVGFQPLPDALGKPVKLSVDADAIELAGGGAGVARVGDACGFLIWDPALMTLFYTSSLTLPYIPITINPSTPSPPALGTPGLQISISSGSGKVSSG